MSIEVKQELSKALLINPDKLEKVDVYKLNEEHMNSIKGAVFSAFCFDNALMAGKILSAKSVVYGAVEAIINGHKKYAEHAWIKMPNGEYFDPTYQNESESKSIWPEISYFKLFEIKISEYQDVAESLGNWFSSVSGMDMVWFRRDEMYEEYFKS